jgi:hypothetical protein
MKNIGEIDSRLNDLEKRVKRQGIDIVALNNKVFDRNGIQGNVLYTTGIFVEDFSTHDAALVSSPYFTATINTEKKECRPAFSGVQHKLFFIADPDVSYRDDIITMPYEEQTLTSQLIPTGFTQVNPSGTLQGSGSSSFWPLALAGAGAYAWAASGGFAASAIGGAVFTDLGIYGVVSTSSVIGTAVASQVASVVGASTISGSIIASVPLVAGLYVGYKILKKLFSDERLKENINKVGEIDGLNVYTFNYKWDKTQQEFGVMASELLNTKYADAVSIHESGFFMVDYSKHEALRNIKGI